MADDEWDREERAQLTRRLTDYLLDLDQVADVRQTSVDDRRQGAKGDPGTMTGVLMTLASTGVLTALIEGVRAWAGRCRCRVRVELDGEAIELDGVGRKTGDRLVKAWIARHTGVQTD